MSNSSPPAAPLTPGDWVDRYELLYPVAQGGMGAVWAARLQSMNSFERLFAVKLILAQYASDPQFRAMFLDEARIAAGISHPNVAQVIDLGEQRGLLYIVMEWLDGDSLSVLHREAVRAGQLLPLGLVLRLTADACAGLHAAHELRDPDGAPLEVVHRDISPHNLLVTSNGMLKIIDFGIAKARNRINETGSGVLKGKIHYMAPEQAAGRDVDRRADLWALGAMLYYFVSGVYAYDGPNDVATLHALMSPGGRAPMPPSVPQPVASVIDRAMCFDREGRYATALEMKFAIEHAIESLSLKATTAMVEAYYRERLAKRVRAREQSLKIGTRAAEERRLTRQVLEERAHTEGPGTSRVGERRRATNHESRHQIEPPQSQSSLLTAGPGLEPTLSEVDEAGGTLATNSLSNPNMKRARARKSALWIGVGSAVVASLVAFKALVPSHPVAPTDADAAARANAARGMAPVLAASLDQASPTPASSASVKPLEIEFVEVPASPTDPDGAKSGHSAAAPRHSTRPVRSSGGATRAGAEATRKTAQDSAIQDRK